MTKALELDRGFKITIINMFKKNKAEDGENGWKENFTRELESINFIVQKIESIERTLELLIDGDFENAGSALYKP